MGKLGWKNYRLLKLVSSDYSLRSHVPLWLTWPSSAFYLSVSLLAWLKKLANCSSLSSSDSLISRRSRWMATVHSVDVMVVLLLFTFDLFVLFLWAIMFCLSLIIVLSTPTEFLHCAKVIGSNRYANPYHISNFKNYAVLSRVYKINKSQLDFHNLLPSLSISPLLTVIFVLVILSVLLLTGMAPLSVVGGEKRKGKAPMGADSVSDNKMWKKLLERELLSQMNTSTKLNTPFGLTTSPRGVGLVENLPTLSKSVPTKMHQIPTLKLTLKKPSSKKQVPENLSSQPEMKGNWNVVGRNNRVMKPVNFAIPNSSIYLSERGGINVIYESEDSEDGLYQLLEPEEIIPDNPILISVAAELHPYNIKDEKNNSVQNKARESEVPMTMNSANANTEVSQSKSISIGNPDPVVREVQASNSNWNKNTRDKATIAQQQADDLSTMMNNSREINLMQNKDIMNGMINPQLDGENTDAIDTNTREMELLSPPGVVGPQGPIVVPSHAGKKLNNESHQPQQGEEEMSEYDEELYEYEYDDLLVDEPLEKDYQPNPLQAFPVMEEHPIMISEDLPFSDKDLEKFINNDALEGNGDFLTSEGTFHSMPNSIHSSSVCCQGDGKTNSPPI